MKSGTVAQTCDCKRDWLWVPSPLEVIKYLIFSFPRSGNRPSEEMNIINCLEQESNPCGSSPSYLQPHSMPLHHDGLVL